MSYLGMELDALNVCADVGASCGLPAAEVCHGLMRMWAWVFRSEKDVASRDQLHGFFYGCEKAPRSLTEFGFLEPRDDGTFRVKGSGRLLGIRRARRAGGLAAKGNLKRGKVRADAGRQPGALPESSRDHSSGSPPADSRLDARLSPGCAPALSPTTDYRLPIGSVPQTGSDLAVRPAITPRDRKPKRMSPQEEFMAWAQERRTEHVAEAGLPFAPDAAWSSVRANKTLGFVREHPAELVRLAYRSAFLSANYPRHLNPPWPMWAFVSDFGKYLSQAQRTGLAEGAAPTPVNPSAEDLYR